MQHPNDIPDYEDADAPQRPPQRQRPPRSDIDKAPAWLRDIDRFLPVAPLFLLTGNIHDRYLITSPDGTDEDYDLAAALWFVLERNGFDALLIYDRFDSFEVYPQTGEATQAAWRVLTRAFDSPREKRLGPRLLSAEEFQTYLENDNGTSDSASDASSKTPSLNRHDVETNRQFWVEGKIRVLLRDVPEILRFVSSSEEPQIAVLIKQGARLLLNSKHINEDENNFFGAMWKLANTSHAFESSIGRVIYPPIFWAVEVSTLLPDWFVIGNERLRQQSLQKPDFKMRRRYAEAVHGMFPEHPEHGPIDSTRLNQLLDVFAAKTEGMSLNEMLGIATMAGDIGRDFTRVDDVVKGYKLGITEDSPWKSDNFKTRIKTAKTKFEARIKGQEPAIDKAINILCRSAMGLSGIHVDENPTKPQGVLFLAGPTGTGKTQLAKEITAQLFNNKDAYIRFDMSEYVTEASESRLIGAPPGYVGYDAGGELTRAIRERPCSVVLFDEIEKAHPRILDKFLQILDDGRLTDNRGDTVYFYEALIIFTSNLGLYREKHLPGGLVRRTPVFDDIDKIDYDEFRNKILAEIKDYFRLKLNRAEILNRIGDNIVVFKFISADIAKEIFRAALARLIENISRKNKVELRVSDKVNDYLEKIAIHEEVRKDGGRGIENQIESHFINPLARALFSVPNAEGAIFTVTECDGKSVELRRETQ